MAIKLSRELRRQGNKLELRYTSGAALLLVVVPSIVGLAVALYLSGTFLGLRQRAILTVLWVAGTGFNTWWLLSGSTVMIDPSRDTIRRGPRIVGRVADVQAVEQRNLRRAPLHLVLADQTGAERRIEIEGLNDTEASAIGREIAATLGVPFRAGSET